VQVRTQKILTGYQEQLCYHEGSQILEQGPREVVGSPSLEIFELALEEALSNLIYVALL